MDERENGGNEQKAPLIEELKSDTISEDKPLHREQGEEEKVRVPFDWDKASIVSAKH